MKLIAISDTHGQHRSMKLPQGDIIVHAGDISSRGRLVEVEDFLDWFSSLNFKHKIFIAGNHDFFFEQMHPNIISKMIPKGVTYLNDSSIEIEGVKFWGSPVTPFFYNWAFNRQRGEDIRKYWELIPDDTDILITHGPPLGILDENSYQQKVGCEELLIKVKQLRLKYHIFGHIHECYGQHIENDTTFVNASVLNAQYQLVRPFQEVSLK